MSGTIFLASTELSLFERDGTTYVEVRRSGPTDNAVTVTYGITPDTATPGLDFVAASGTVTIAAGADRALIPVTVLNDNLVEPTEVFSLALINADGAALAAPRTLRISIVDGESPVVPPPEPPLVSNYDLDFTPVVNGTMNQPVRFAFSPLDPTRLYVAGKDGFVMLADTDAGTFASIYSFTEEVNNLGDRGLMGIALHPDLANHPYMYLFYVVDPPDASGGGSAGRNGDGNRYAHLARVTLDAATDYTTVVPDSRVVLLGGAGQSLADISGGGARDHTSPTWSGQPSSERFAGVTPATWVDGFKQDYIKVDSKSHAGGQLLFGPDGMLYVATGDGTSFNYADPRTPEVQSIHSLSGKILRIDPITGNGLADNPFVTPGMDLDSNAAKVFQLGLRNPFSFAFAPDGRTVVGDVGWWSFEEVNAGGPGANFGWPWFEGGDGILRPTPVYRDMPAALAFYQAIADGTANPLAPLRGFAHDSAAPGPNMQAIVGGGVVYDGDRYPAEFKGDYFFSDFVTGRIFSVDVNRPEELRFITQVEGRPGPIHMMQGPDGYIWYADIVTGQIGRIEIAPAPPAQSWLPLGDAMPLVDGTFQLTPPGDHSTGGIGGTTRIDLREHLRIAFEVWQATAPGRDGFALLLHNDPRGADAIGGGELGFTGMQKTLALAFQTWQGNGGPLAHDHGRLMDPNDAGFGVGQVEPVDLGRIDDGAWHRVELRWNPDSQRLEWFWDGVLRDWVQADIAQAVFGGSNFARLAITAAGGPGTPDQRVRDIVVDAQFEDVAGNQLPVIFGGPTRSLSVMENSAGIFHIPRATDAELAALAWRIAGGADAALFNIDAGTGALSFKVAPNFEAPRDIGRDNTYELVIEVADPEGGKVLQSLAVTVTDQLVEVIQGTAAAETLRGGINADILIGAGGNDRLLGGAGNDSFIATAGDGNDVINGGAGVDLLSLADIEVDSVVSLHTRRSWSSVTGNDSLAGIENLTGGAGNDQLIGDAGSNILIGNSGADSIWGGDGDDSLDGGNGNDRLDGGLGADIMAGGRGGDRYVVDDEEDVVIEIDAPGYDSVTTLVDFTMPAHVERLALSGAAIRGIGNDIDNSISGNALSNWLDGGAGGDTMDGGEGNDTMVGGAGSDRLAGGAGRDVFLFRFAFEGRDRITDYAGVDDTIQVSAAGFGGGLVAGMNLMATGRYVANTTGNATSASGIGQFTFETDTFLLRWDPDGSGGSSAFVLADLRGATGWSGSEIVVIA